MRAGHRKGGIAPGFDADILAVDGDPITDPDALHRIRAVYAHGAAMPGAGPDSRPRPPPSSGGSGRSPQGWAIPRNRWPSGGGGDGDDAEGFALGAGDDGHAADGAVASSAIR